MERTSVDREVRRLEGACFARTLQLERSWTMPHKQDGGDKRIMCSLVELGGDCHAVASIFQVRRSF
ncbi:MAG TPA: hypothetical protein DDY91_09775 [Planctomycetaceae bacterium]|nr:hypothetical protein [Planctomycetaceae bacterium]